MSRAAYWGILVFLVLVSVFGFAVPPIVLILHLLIGWVGYLIRVVPQVQIDWGGVALAAACLAGVLLLGHRTARWLWRETRPTELRGVSRWRVGWTLAAAATVVLTFACGIAAVGVTHQAAWLARSDQRMFEYGGRTRERANQIKCASNLRQIGWAILEYAKNHGGTFPPDVETAAIVGEVSAWTFICPSSDHQAAHGQDSSDQIRQLRHGHTSYVYHGRGLTHPAPADRPIACEPLANHRGAGMNVLFGDGRVDFIPAADVRQVMARLDTPPPTTRPATSPASKAEFFAPDDPSRLAPPAIAPAPSPAGAAK